jgi:DNA-binding beta-propeller fold protein YncE
VSDVVEVDTKGRVVVSYTNQLKSTTQHKFNVPRHLSVDKNNEFILVADTGNNRIVILNRSLKSCARELNVTVS